MLLNLSEWINHLKKKKKDVAVRGKRMSERTNDWTTNERPTDRTNQKWTNKHSPRRLVAAFILQSFQALISKKKLTSIFDFFSVFPLFSFHLIYFNPWLSMNSHGLQSLYRWKNVCALPFRHIIKHGFHSHIIYWISIVFS